MKIKCYKKFNDNYRSVGFIFYRIVTFVLIDYTTKFWFENNSVIIFNCMTN